MAYATLQYNEHSSSSQEVRVNNCTFESKHKDIVTLTCQKHSLLSEMECDARNLPSGLKATAVTPPLCAGNTWMQREKKVGYMLQRIPKSMSITIPVQAVDL